MSQILARDVPCFSGVVLAGPEVVVCSRYRDAGGDPMVNIKAGFVEIDGLSADAIVDSLVQSPF